MLHWDELRRALVGAASRDPLRRYPGSHCDTALGDSRCRGWLSGAAHSRTNYVAVAAGVPAKRVARHLPSHSPASSSPWSWHQRSSAVSSWSATAASSSQMCWSSSCSIGSFNFAFKALFCSSSSAMVRCQLLHFLADVLFAPAKRFRRGFAGVCHFRRQLRAPDRGFALSGLDLLVHSVQVVVVRAAVAGASTRRCALTPRTLVAARPQ